MSETTKEKLEQRPERSANLLPVDPKKTHSKPPFKVCFVLHEELGRSHILPFKPKRIAFPIITPKFYSKYDCEVLEDTDPKIIEDLKRLQETGPKEKYTGPATENHRYGWYTDLEHGCDRRDTRFYFPRRVSQIVKIKSLIDHAESVTKSKKL